MSLRCRIEPAALALVLTLAGCDREDRNPRGSPVAESVPGGASQPTVHAGGPTSAPLDPRAALYEGNSYQISQGQLLFKQMNCSGCHAQGGGAMGPALMDDQWRYGGSMVQIVETIDQGRPGGMPSWHGRLTEQQMWQLAAYVRSLSGQADKDVSSSRGDEMSNGEPIDRRSREPVRPASADSVKGTTP